MLEAGFWGLAAGAALLLGAVVGLRATIPARALGLIMGFGAGVLISALAFELTRESFTRGGRTSVAIGLAAGGLAFYFGDRLIDRMGGEHRKRSGEQMAGANATALTLGALLDGIPESVAIGVTLLEGEGVGIAFVAAVFLSNVPESLSAATGMRKAGHTARYVLGVWTSVVIVSAVSAALGFALLGGVSDGVIATIQAFAAGAILVMLADTMMPEAFEEGGSSVGLVTLLGFALAFILSTLE